MMMEKDLNLLRISLEEEERIAKPSLALPHGLLSFLGSSDKTPLLIEAFFFLLNATELRKRNVFESPSLPSFLHSFKESTY